MNLSQILSFKLHSLKTGNWFSTEKKIKIVKIQKKNEELISKQLLLSMTLLGARNLVTKLFMTKRKEF